MGATECSSAPATASTTTSDGFHYIGYAETVNVVRTANDLLNWTVLNQLDNPILSTDTVTDVTDPSKPRPYPLNPPIVNVTRRRCIDAGPGRAVGAADPCVTVRNSARRLQLELLQRASL